MRNSHLFRVNFAIPVLVHHLDHALETHDKSLLSKHIVKVFIGGVAATSALSNYLMDGEAA